MYVAVPPPPRHNPPRLPLDKKPPIDSEPPPLPPANTTGRRSRVYTNKMKHEILQNLHENSAPNSSKLCFITVFLLIALSITTVAPYLNFQQFYQSFFKQPSLLEFFQT